MFSNAQSPHITGGSFKIITNVNTGDGPSMYVLHNRVAPNAILNTGGRADEVRCHPGTREEVIGRIEKWGDAQDDLSVPMFWLSGPAGAGKSAIMQTIAERCEERAVPHANFFFFRADTSRSNAFSLIATLLHQIILLYPSLRAPVATLLSANPFIFDSTLENQLTQLIFKPLYSVQELSSPYRPLLLLIDGLDECDSETKRSQQQILRAFDEVLAQHPEDCPLRLLVASRDESQIQIAFNGLSSQCIRLYLDAQYSPENDIRVFVEAQFDQVRKTHPLAYKLGAAWPSLADIEYVVDKSSGQFIYAATVMRFILKSSASPKLSLERVRGAARLATKSPFSQLDAIYTYILTQADDQEAVKDIFHAHFLIGKLTPFLNASIRFGTAEPLDIPLIELLRHYNPRYTEEVVLSCVADLTPIAWCDSQPHKLLFHHASFPDYLQDQSRSTDYFVDTTAFNYKIVPKIWEAAKSGDPDEARDWARFGFLGILELQKLPPGLMDTFASSSDVWFKAEPTHRASIIKIFHNLCVTDDDVNTFKRILPQLIRSFGTHHVDLNAVENIPSGRRYLQMARADSSYDLHEHMEADLRPATDFDRHESEVWVNNLLHRMHESTYSRDPRRYENRLKTWITWANKNNIPCHGLDDLPHAKKYIWEGTTKGWVAEKFKSMLGGTKK